MSLQIILGQQKAPASFYEKARRGLESFNRRSDIGFSQIPERKAIWTSVKATGDKLRENYQTMVVVGIGGSALGPRVLVDLYQSPKSSHQVLFCDNVDPWEFDRLFQSIRDIEKTCWVFISKSGSTIETLTSLDFIHQKIGSVLSSRSLVISEPKSSPLMDWAKSYSVPCLEIPFDVGGRFSVLTSVGLVPAAFLGLDIEKIRAGAQEALRNSNQVIEMMALALASFDREEWISQFWFYSSGLKNFGAWLQQLWAESLAKKLDRSGDSAPRVSTPLSQVGACDQHSVLQQVMEGARDKWVVFTRVNSLESDGEVLKKTLFAQHQFLEGKKLGHLLGAEANATQEALNRQGVSTLILSVPDLNPQSLGELFMFWQLVVAGLGECLDINAFDQPGVELGKQLAKESLKR
jgi:glucose-6-phosphate isomerase